VEYYDTVFALAESPLKKGMLWAGTDDGLVQLTLDDGGTWFNVTPRELPEWSMISIVEPSPHQAGAAYIAVGRHKLGDFKPYIYKTKDYGKSWQFITNGIAEGAYVYAVREDPVREGLLYAGTEVGVFFSLDDGGHWAPLELNLPTVPVHDLVIKGNDLVVATHGRSFWVLDDITPLRQMDANTASAEMFLYAPSPSYRLHNVPQWIGRRPLGENPPSGAVIDYYFRTAPKGEVTIQIFDPEGGLVRTLSSIEKKEFEQPPEWPEQFTEKKTIPASAGMQRCVWDLRYEDPVKVPGAFYTGTGPHGPLVLPGKYQVRLTAEGKTQTVTLEVLADSRVKVAPGDLEKQFELSRDVCREIDRMHAAVNQIRGLESQLQPLRKRFGEDPKLKPLLAAAGDLEGKLTQVEDELIQVNMKASELNLAFPNMLNEQFDSFAASVESADAVPTAQQLEVFKMLSGRLDEQIQAYDGILAKDLPAFEELAKSYNITLLYVPKGRR
jgi:hypothetical protein